MVNDPDAHLTEAASNVLDLYLADARERIIFDASRTAAKLSDLREVGVPEVLSAIQKQDQHLPGGVPSSRALRYRRLAVAYLTLGVSVAGFGAILYLTILLQNNKFSTAQYVAILTAIVGVLTGLAGVVLLAVARTRTIGSKFDSAAELSDERLASNFLWDWTLFERRLLEVAAEKFGESTTTSRRRTVDLLRKSKVLSDEDFNEYKNLQAIRNSIVHGSPRDQPLNSTIRTAMVVLQGLMNKISSH